MIRSPGGARWRRGAHWPRVQLTPSCLPSLHPQKPALPALRCVPPPADAHPESWLDADAAGKQTQLSAAPASHSAGLVRLKRLPLNLPLSAPPGITSVAGAGWLLCCAWGFVFFFFFAGLPIFFVRCHPVPAVPGHGVEHPLHRHPPLLLAVFSTLLPRVWFPPPDEQVWGESEFC